MYPLEKYRYYTSGKKVIAVSTYGGKTVRGVASCDPQDTFNLETGKRLAALRCAKKIANKRIKRARLKLDEANAAFVEAKRHLYRMIKYYDNAVGEKNEIDSTLFKMKAYL